MRKLIERGVQKNISKIGQIYSLLMPTRILLIHI